MLILTLVLEVLLCEVYYIWGAAEISLSMYPPPLHLPLRKRRASGLALPSQMPAIGRRFDNLVRTCHIEVTGKRVALQCPSGDRAERSLLIEKVNTMSNDNPVAARKVAIAPITFVIEVTAERVSEKGTFSGLKVTSVKSSVKDLAGHLKVSVPPAGGGAMYLRSDSLKGVKVLGEVSAKTPTPTVKLF